ncbi:acyl CoA:acetate/3-ketoacid CoA transferase [Massilicoli timonensis]|uniref:acyl CoA:acetate/3-ketoacid CoA transferase n=1 Tax=Massilicoli timonensis TaxID=2015901 RepID=UPI0023F4BA6A|nr:acyl CoA:acetate/3-ketoacid CoA transferase [Massilicoli timonensis]
MSKIISLEQAVSMIKDGDKIGIGGFIGSGHPQEFSVGIEESFLKSGHPRDLTIMFSAGIGDGTDRLGLNKLGHEGLLKRIIGGHWGLIPKLQRLVFENKVEGYNLPLGTISLLFREIAGHRPGVITKVGLKTFVDPRLEGGKMNERSKEDLVELMHIDGEEWLRYKSFPLNVALIRATYCDEDGNATMEKEAATLDSLSIAQAAKNSGGIVLLQVEKVVQNGTLDPRKVKIPGIYVDGIVVSRPENHWQTYEAPYNPALSGEVKVPVDSIAPMPLNPRKVVCRRAAMELDPKAIINLGIGMPEGIANVANEEGLPGLKLTVEAGGIGGVPMAGTAFGTCTNPDAIIDQPYQFDFYDGGGLDQAFLGLAECDKDGNINVSRFGPKIAGCGGFINITQTAPVVVYCGTFTASGLKESFADGKLTIVQEGKIKKFKENVEQITFSAQYAHEVGQKVMYVTERAVFELLEGKLTLTEIAPGVDLQKDILDQMEFMPAISENLKEMDTRLFREEKMGLV